MIALDEASSLYYLLYLRQTFNFPLCGDAHFEYSKKMARVTLVKVGIRVQEPDLDPPWNYAERRIIGMMRELATSHISVKKHILVGLCSDIASSIVIIPKPREQSSIGRIPLGSDGAYLLD